MYDVWSFKGIDALVSSGLGGGSLIYANVLLRKDEKWFVHESPHPLHPDGQVVAEAPHLVPPAARHLADG